jgi:uncharacterized protein (DUF362 family)
MTDVCLIRSDDAYDGTRRMLETLRFSCRNKKVLIKPNLTGALPGEHGMTVDTGAVRAVCEKLIDCPVITIGESCSKVDCAFEELGYRELQKDFPNIRLVDMRDSVHVWKPISRPYHTKCMPFAKEIFEHDYIINIAKMKTHSLAGITLCLKNIFGAVPTRKQKLMYHPFIRKAMLDMNQIVRSDFSIVEGIWGNEYDEILSTPVKTGVIVGGEHIVAVDTIAAQCMGIDVGTLDTYRRARKLFGNPEIRLLGGPVEDVAKKFRRGCLPSTRVRYVQEALLSLSYRAVMRH